MLVLDTQALIWLTESNPKLSQRAEAAIAEELKHGDGGIAIAAVTLWELVVLENKGRLRFSPSLASFLGRVEEIATILPLTGRIALQAISFGKHFPKDPADRQIAATALVHGVPLVTSDSSIQKSNVVKCIW